MFVCDCREKAASILFHCDIYMEQWEKNMLSQRTYGKKVLEMWGNVLKVIFMTVNWDNSYHKSGNITSILISYFRNYRCRT